MGMLKEWILPFAVVGAVGIFAYYNGYQDGYDKHAAKTDSEAAAQHQINLTNYIKDNERLQELNDELNAKVLQDRVTINRITDNSNRLQYETETLRANLKKKDASYAKDVAAKTTVLLGRCEQREAEIIGYTLTVEQVAQQAIGRLSVYED